MCFLAQVSYTHSLGSIMICGPENFDYYLRFSNIDGTKDWLVALKQEQLTLHILVSYQSCYPDF